MIRVLMIGNDNSVKGGITSVITQMLNYDWEKNNIEMIFIPSYKGGNAIFKLLFFAYAFMKVMFVSIFKRPNIVHMHMSYRGSFSRKYLLYKWFDLMKIPFIIHLHGSEFKSWFESVSFKKQERIRRLLRKCDYMIVLGEKWKKNIYEIEPQCTTIVVENSIAIPDYTVEWKQKEFRFLFMGVLIKRKGVHDLIIAVKYLVENYPKKNFLFEIAGTGEEETALKKLVEKNNLQSYFNFTGWISGEEKARCYERANVLVLPSYNEGLPIAILEAISYGLPVISTDVGDISSAVHNNENGYLIEPGDIVQLAECMDNINNKEIYERFSQYSKQLAINKFNEKRFFDTILNLYQAMCED